MLKFIIERSAGILPQLCLETQKVERISFSNVAKLVVHKQNILLAAIQQQVWI
jgi:hypothetical protein